MIRNDYFVSGLLLTVVLFAISCGGASSAQPTTKPQATDQPSASREKTSAATVTKIDACTLITKAEAEAILGEPAKDAEKTDNSIAGNLVSECKYASANPASIKAVAIRTSQWPTTLATKYEFEQPKLSGAEGIDVPGIGDAAIYRSNVKTLFVLKGNVYMMVMLFEIDSATDSTKTLALKALSRLA